MYRFVYDASSSSWYNRGLKIDPGFVLSCVGYGEPNPHRKGVLRDEDTNTNYYTRPPGEKPRLDRHVFRMKNAPKEGGLFSGGKGKKGQRNVTG